VGVVGSCVTVVLGVGLGSVCGFWLTKLAKSEGAEWVQSGCRGLQCCSSSSRVTILVVGIVPICELGSAPDGLRGSRGGTLALLHLCGWGSMVDYLPTIQHLLRDYHLCR
jgi:hypothetical protein